MKRFSIFAFILVLTLSLFSACRGPMKEPTVIPTQAPVTEAATLPTQAPETVPTVPETTDGMMDPGNTLESTGAAHEDTGATGAADQQRSRMR